MLTDVDKEVILAYADCNMNTYHAAKKIYLHRNTIMHHLKKVRRLTGLDPLNFYDLHKLVAMVREEHLSKEGYRENRNTEQTVSQ